jgi:hypothetical protein
MITYDPDPLISLLYGPIIRARYPGRCITCRRWMRRGQPIVRLDGGWAHAVSICVRQSRLARSA